MVSSPESTAATAGASPQPRPPEHPRHHLLPAIEWVRGGLGRPFFSLPRHERPLVFIGCLRKFVIVARRRGTQNEMDRHATDPMRRAAHRRHGRDIIQDENGDGTT
jgi:hypothetical protein